MPTKTKTPRVEGTTEEAVLGMFREAQAVLLEKEEWTEEWGSEELQAYYLLKNYPPHLWPKPKPGPKPEGVVIIGKAHGDLVAPWLEEGLEFWGLNEASKKEYGRPPLEHHQRWFQLHPPRYLEEHYPQGIDDLEFHWARDRGVRLYMDEAYREYPNSEPYPKEAVEALTPRGIYHCSSMDWMLALAIHENFKRIVCCGLHLVSFPVLNGEPISGRSCLEYWSGVADGRGIELEYRGPSGHMFQNLHLAVYESQLQYGFEREPALDLTKAKRQDGDEKRWTDLR